jgi:hypothetical protein
MTLRGGVPAGKLKKLTAKTAALENQHGSFLRVSIFQGTTRLVVLLTLVNRS